MLVTIEIQRINLNIVLRIKFPYLNHTPYIDFDEIKVFVQKWTLNL